jgi:predicted acylesterase/phospholipase RssA
VAATSAIPGIFPPVATRIAGRPRLLVDPGWFTAVPVESAFAPPIAARRVIAVDLSLLSCPRQARRRYWDRLGEAWGDRLLILRPHVRGCGTMISRPGDAARLVEAGRESVDTAALRTLRSWIAAP